MVPADWNHLCPRVSDEFDHVFGQRRSLANLKYLPSQPIYMPKPYNASAWAVLTSGAIVVKEGVLALP